MTSCSLSSRDGYPLSPPACRSDPNWPARPVSILCTYAWCPVSQSRTSCGEENTRCSAMVSSTTPRFGPRWPPVRATDVTRCSRISVASASSSERRSLLTSAGHEIVEGGPARGRVYVRPAGAPLRGRHPRLMVLRDGTQRRRSAVRASVIERLFATGGDLLDRAPGRRANANDGIVAEHHQGAHRVVDPVASGYLCRHLPHPPSRIRQCVEDCLRRHVVPQPQKPA